MADDYGVEYEPEYWATGGGYSGTNPSLGGAAWDRFTGWGDPYGPGSSGDTGYGGEAGGSNWLSSILGSLGGLSGVLGPALQAGGALAGGAIGSNASNDAARLQANALNRGIDLSTSQWLQQLERTQPWVQAGQESLGTLQGLAGREAPGVPGQIPTISGQGYALPAIAPTWGPQTYAGYTPGAVPEANRFGYQGPPVPSAGDYRWTPGQGPRAQDFRYAPGQTPDAAAYRYTPGAVPTLSGKELLANDPGVQFRMDEGRKALEASAAARGGLLSGPTLAALQRQGQELGSQEYSNAWNRASQQAQMREGWAQQAGAQNFGQAMSAAELRERVNQLATQQGWSQSTAEAAFREAMASQASQQGFSQALTGQGQQWQQGLAGQQFDWNRAVQEAQQREQGAQFGFGANLQAQQLGQRERQAYDQSVYDRMMQQSNTQYGRDVAQNEQDVARQQTQYRQQLAQYLLPWEQNSVLASLGGQMAGQLGSQGIASASGISNLLGQLGSAQGIGTLGQAGQWNQAIAGGVGGLQNVLKGLNA